MSSLVDFGQRLEAFSADYEALRREIAGRVVGQEEAAGAALTALMAGGHVLLEGPPGTGKTLLARALADAIEATFQRIQGTADLMPSDLIGTYVIMESPQGRRTFEFHKGPLFAHVVLVDHLNRVAPKTQSALFQAMEDEAVTVATESFALPRPYLIVATQNPVEQEGTYPLPEAELDRFLLKARLRPATPDELEAILERTTEPGHAPRRQVLGAQRVLEMQGLVRQVAIPQAVRRQAVALAAATWPEGEKAPEAVRRLVRWGAGPRGAQALVLAAKARAAAAGRREVSRDDLLRVARPALGHRLILNDDAVADGVAPDAVLDQVLQAVLPP